MFWREHLDADPDRLVTFVNGDGEIMCVRRRCIESVYILTNSSGLVVRTTSGKEFGLAAGVTYAEVRHKIEGKA